MITMNANNIGTYTPTRTEKYHFRVLILDPNMNRTEMLENSFLSMYNNSRDVREAVMCEDTQFYYVRNAEQLSTIPGVSAYNAAWISSDFPNYIKTAESFYLENPFCYQVFYGEISNPITQILHSRPIGHVNDISIVDDVYREMTYIWKVSACEKGVLKLTSRSAFCTVAFERILYCQSQAHKSYIYVNTPVRNVKVTEDDIFVKNADNKNELFAYVQNKKLDDLITLFPEDKFVRIHQSYIVNKHYSIGIRRKSDGWFLVVMDLRDYSIEIPISERYRSQAKAIFGFESK